eukprot:g2601.t1
MVNFGTCTFRLLLLFSVLFYYWSILLDFVCLVVFERLHLRALFHGQLTLIFASALVDGVVGGYATSTKLDVRGFCLGLLHVHVVGMAIRSFREGVRAKELVFGTLVQSAVSDGPQAILCAFADLTGEAAALVQQSVFLRAVRLNCVTSVLGGAMALVANERRVLEGVQRAGTTPESLADTEAPTSCGQMPCACWAHCWSYWTLLFVFRCCELGSRVLSVALFCFFTRLHGFLALLVVDLLLMWALLHLTSSRQKGGSGITFWSQVVLVAMLFVTNPSGFSEFSPRVPHDYYFVIRLSEFLVLALLSAHTRRFRDIVAGTSHHDYDRHAMLMVATFSTLLAAVLFPFVRRAASDQQEYRSIGAPDQT